MKTPLKLRKVALLVAWGLASLATPFVLAAPVPAAPKEFYISEPEVALYAAPTEKSKVRAHLGYSTVVKVLEQKANWYHVRALTSATAPDGWLKGHRMSATKIAPQPFVHHLHRYALQYPPKTRFQAVDEDTLYLKVDLREPLAVIGIQMGYSTQEDLEKVVNSHPLSLVFQQQQLEEDARSGLLFIREAKKTLLNGQSAWHTHFFVHSQPLPPAGVAMNKPVTTLEGHQYLLLQNGKVFSLTVAAPSGKYAAFSTVLDKAVRSFKLPAQ